MFICSWAEQRTLQFIDSWGKRSQFANVDSGEMFRTLQPLSMETCRASANNQPMQRSLDRTWSLVNR